MWIHTHSKTINFDNDFFKIKKLSLRAFFHSGLQLSYHNEWQSYQSMVFPDLSNNLWNEIQCKELLIENTFQTKPLHIIIHPFSIFVLFSPVFNVFYVCIEYCLRVHVYVTFVRYIHFAIIHKCLRVHSTQGTGDYIW